MFFVFDASTLFRPRWPTWGPKWAILRPKTGPRRAQDGFKTASRWHRKRASKTSSSWVAFGANLGPKMGPSWGPRRAQEGSKNRFNFASTSYPVLGPTLGQLGAQNGPTWAPKSAYFEVKKRISYCNLQYILRFRHVPS